MHLCTKYTKKVNLFRQGLVRGEVEIIHPILTWFLTHIDVIRKRAYLSRFLIKVMYQSCLLNARSMRLK